MPGLPIYLFIFKVLDEKKERKGDKLRQRERRAQQDQNASQWMDGRRFVDVNICKDVVISSPFSACLTQSVEYTVCHGGDSSGPVFQRTLFK